LGDALEAIFIAGVGAAGGVEGRQAEAGGETHV